MLQNIRDNAQGWLAWVVVVIIIIPFALWGINEYITPKASNAIAVVNDVEIPRELFQENYQQYSARLRQQLQGQSVNFSKFEKEIKKNVLDQLIEDEVLTQATHKGSMGVGNQLLASQIQSIEVFQEKNMFSQARYETLLRGQGMTPQYFEENMRRNLLVEQLRTGLQQSTFTTTHEQRMARREREQQRLVTYLLVPAKQFSEKIILTDAEIEAYFSKHQDQFMAPEKVKVEYVELSLQELKNQIEVNDAVLTQRYERDISLYRTESRWRARQILLEANKDEADQGKARAEEILAKARSGEDFATLAKAHSVDSITKSQGGDMGWIAKGEQRQPIETALAAMQIGQISELTQTEFGWHILKLEEYTPPTTKPFNEVREQLAEAYRNEEAEAKYYAMQEQFANLAFEQADNLNVLSETLKLPKNATGWFTKEGAEEDGIAKEKQVIEAAFSDRVLREQSNSHVLELGDKRIVVIHLLEHQPAIAQTLAEVKDTVATLLRTEKTREQTKAVGEEIQRAFTTDGDWLALLSNHGLLWEKARWYKRTDKAEAPREILLEAFKMGVPSGENEGLLHGLVLGDDYALVAVLAVNYPDTEAADNVIDAGQSFQLRAMGESEYQGYLGSLKGQSTITTHLDEL